MQLSQSLAFALADRINFYKAERRKAIQEKIVLEATYESEGKIAEAERLRVEEELRHAGLQLTDYMENLQQKNNLVEQFRCDVEHLETQLKMPA